MFVLLFYRSFLNRFLLFILVACFSYSFFSAAQAADVLLSPSSGAYSTGQTFTATVQVNPAGDSVNAVEAQLSFNPSVLSVVSLSKTAKALAFHMLIVPSVNLPLDWPCPI